MSPQTPAPRAKPGATVAPLSPKKGAAEVQGPAASLDAAVLRFISSHDVDDKAASALCNAAPTVQRIVMERASFKNIHNPSAAVMAQIRDLSTVTLPPKGDALAGSARPVDAAVLDFIRTHDLDNQAANALRSVSSALQQSVMQKVDFARVRNPSAVVMAHLREAVSAAEIPGNVSRPASLAKRVAAFLDSHSVDDRAAQALRGCKPAIQEAVLNRGSLASAHNVSSLLLGRIRDAVKNTA